MTEDCVRGTAASSQSAVLLTTRCLWLCLAEDVLPAAPVHSRLTLHAPCCGAAAGADCTFLNCEQCTDPVMDEAFPAL